MNNNLEEISKKIQFLLNPYLDDRNGRKFEIHYNPDSDFAFVLLENLKKTYPLTDFSKSIKNNSFKFEAEGLEFMLIENSHIFPKNSYKVFQYSNYNLLKRKSDLFHTIYSIPENYVNVNALKEQTKFLVANNIHFRGYVGNKKIEIVTKEPYKYYFTRLGVKDGVIDVMVDIAKEKINKKIEKLCMSYLRVENF